MIGRSIGCAESARWPIWCLCDSPGMPSLASVDTVRDYGGVLEMSARPAAATALERKVLAVLGRFAAHQNRAKIEPKTTPRIFCADLRSRIRVSPRSLTLVLHFDYALHGWLRIRARQTIQCITQAKLSTLSQHRSTLLLQCHQIRCDRRIGYCTNKTTQLSVNVSSAKNKPNYTPKKQTAKNASSSDDRYLDTSRCHLHCPI